MRKSGIITLCLCALCISLFSCNGGKLKEAEAQNQILADSLADERAAQDSLLSLLTEVTNGMSQIKQMEKIINSTNFNSETPSQKEAIKSDMILLAQTLKDRRNRIEELERKLKNSGLYNNKLESSIKALKEQISQQSSEISTLQESLQKANIVIEDLTIKVESLNDAVDSVTTAKNEAEQEAIRIGNELNTCYYVIGSNKELKENSILEKKFLGKTKVLEGDYELSYFTKADKRTLKEIPLYSKKAKVWTKQAEDSYEIIDNNGVKTLKIVNPTKFWELSNFLVIQID